MFRNSKTLHAILVFGAIAFGIASSALAQFSDLTSATEPWAGKTDINVTYFGGTTWAIGGANGMFKTSTDLVTWTDRTSSLGFGTTAINAIGYNGTTWAVGGENGTLKTSTNLTTWTDGTSALNFGTNAVTAIETNGTIWAVGGESGALKSTTDFSSYTDRTSALGFTGPVNDINYSVQKAYWLFLGMNKQFKSSTNLSAYTDRSGMLTGWGAGTDGYAVRTHTGGSGAGCIVVGGGNGVGSPKYTTIQGDWSGSNDNSADWTAFSTSDIKTIGFSLNGQGAWLVGGGTTVASDGIGAGCINAAGMSDVTSNVGLTQPIGRHGIAADPAATVLYVIGGSYGFLKSTTDNTFTAWTDRRRNSAAGGAVCAAATDGTTWVAGGNHGELHTSTNLSSFTDRTSALSWGDSDGTAAACTDGILSIAQAGGTWAIGGSNLAANNKLKTTTDFTAFTDRDANLVGGLSVISAAAAGPQATPGTTSLPGAAGAGTFGTPNNALTQSDSLYATAATTANTQEYTTFTLGVPGGSTVTGIASTVAGKIAGGSKTLKNTNSPSALYSNSAGWTNGANAYTSNNSYAQVLDSASAKYQTFGYSLPPGVTIQGISVGVEGYYVNLTEPTQPAFSARFNVSFSKTGCAGAFTGTFVTAPKLPFNTDPNIQTKYVAGSSSQLWGFTWTPADFSDANFCLQFSALAVGIIGDTYQINLDSIVVNVYTSGGSYSTAPTADALSNWTTTANATADQVAPSGSVATAAANQIGYFRGLGFSVPSGSTITGIVVGLDTWQTAGNTSRFDVALADPGQTCAGTFTGTVRSTANLGLVEPDNTTTYSAGVGTTDLWGKAWTSADVNSVNFCFKATYIKVGGGPAPTSSIDYVRIYLYYTIPPDAAFKVELWNQTKGAYASLSRTSANLTGASPPDTVATVGSAGDLWGETWSAAADFGASFKIRVTPVFVDGSVAPTTYYLEYVNVVVYYESSTTYEWMFGGAGGQLNETSNLGAAFTDRTSALGFGGSAIYAVERSGGLWAVGGAGGKLKTTADFANYTDATLDLSFGGYPIYVIESGVTRSSGSTIPPTAFGSGGANDEADFSNDNNAYSSNDSYASASAANQKEVYKSFTFGLAGTETIRGIGVNVEGKVTTSGGSPTKVPTNYGGFEWSFPENALLSDGSYATGFADSAPSQTYMNFGYALPSGSTIQGIKLGFESYRSGGAGAGCSAQMNAQLSWDNCTSNFTANKVTPNLPTSDPNNTTTVTLGSSSDTWGHTWSYSEVNDANLCAYVYVTDNFGNCNLSEAVVSTDYLVATVYYTDGSASKFKVEVWKQSKGGWAAETKNTNTLTSTDATTVLGNSGELWGETGWVSSDFSSANFKIRITSILESGSAPVSWDLDAASVKLYYDGTQPTWAIGGGSGKLFTTTDFTTFTDQSTALGFGSSDIRAMNYHQGVWAFGGTGGKLVTTEDFVTFTDRTTALGFSTKNDNIYAMTGYNPFLIGGDDHSLSSNNSNPLAVELVMFDATGYDGEVQVYWETGSEVDNVGFNLYRAQPGSKNWTLLTPQPISGLNTSATGGKYLYRDLNVQNGATYYYYLEDIDFFSGGKLHGPAQATPLQKAGAAKPLSAGEQAEYAAIVLSTQLSGNATPAMDVGSSPSSSGVSVISSTDQSTLLEIDLHDWNVHGSRVEIDGFGQCSLPNRPIVPCRALLVGVPARELASYSFTVVKEEEQSGVNLEIGSVTQMKDAEGNVVEPFGSGVDPTTLTPSEIPGQWSTTNGVYPSKYVETGGSPLRFNDHEGLLTLQLTPVKYDASNSSISVAEKILVSLQWGEELPAPATTVAPSKVQDDLARSGNSLKLAIRTSGLYRIIASDLIASGWPSQMGREEVCLYRKGEPIPMTWEGSGSGPLGTDGAFTFYGAYEWTRQAPENVYWLTAESRCDHTPPTQMGVVDPSDSDVAPWTTVHTEPNKLYVLAFPGDRSTDRFMWGSAGWYPPVPPVRPNPIVVPFSGPFALSGINFASLSSPVVTYQLQPITSDEDRNPDHHLRVLINGTVVEDFYAEGTATLTRSVSVALSLLQEGANTISVQEVGDASLKLQSTYMNWLDVRYPRISTWDGVGNLTLSFAQTGLAHLSGLTLPSSVEVWNVTDPRNAKKLSDVTVDGLGEIVFTAKKGQSYQLISVPSSVSRVWKNEPADLRSLSSSNALYISYKDFLPAAQGLATYRTKFYKNAQVIDVEDIYDQYSYGDVSDDAITTLIQEKAAQSNASFSVLLLGDASVDPHDYLNKGFKNFVPTHLFWDGVFETASDTLLMFGEGGTINPAIPFGRIPASTLAEAQTVVDKIIRYEASDPADAWMKNLSFVADNAVPAGSWEEEFATFTTDLSQSLPADYTKNVDLLGVLGTVQTRTNVKSRFNDGSLFINFLGHGAYAYWASEMVLQSSDVPALTNADRLPIVTAMNCLNGYFVDHSTKSLSELIMLSNVGGSVAYLSSSGLNQLGALELLSHNLYHQMTTAQPASLGLAVAKERAALTQVNDLGPAVYTMHLFGDPDLWIPGISPVPQAPPSASSIVDLSVTGDGPNKLDFQGSSPTSAQSSDSMGCKSTGGFFPLFLMIFFVLPFRRFRAGLSLQKLGS